MSLIDDLTLAEYGEMVRGATERRPMTDQGGRIPLHSAALENRADDVRTLIAEGADVNAVDLENFTPLHFAAQQGSLEAAQLLVDAGADVERTNTFGNTPLMVSVLSGKGTASVITLLREHGADVNHENNYGKTPLGTIKIMANPDKHQAFADLLDAS